MDKFGLKNYSAAVRFVRGAFKEQRNGIFSDKALTELGRKAQITRFLQQLAADVWENDLYVDYVAQKAAMEKLIEIHMAKKPKTPTPTAEQVILENRAHKQLMTRLAMAKDTAEAVAALKEVVNGDNVVIKNAMLVNYGEVMDKVHAKLSATGTGAPGAVAANLWDEGQSLKPGDKIARTAANSTAQATQLSDVLKKIYVATTASLKTEKEIKWETTLEEYVNEDSRLNGQFAFAQRTFERMWRDEFGADFNVKAERIVLDPWVIAQPEDEFLAAAKKAGTLDGIGKYPGYR